MTERKKLKMGFWYDANNDTELLEQRYDAEELCYFLNQTSPKMAKKREEIMGTLLPNRGKDTTILSPFYTDYGYNCFIGDNTFINHNAYLMDGAPIKIGSYCFIGPKHWTSLRNTGLLITAQPAGFFQNRRILPARLIPFISCAICAHMKIPSAGNTGSPAILSGMPLVPISMKTALTS